MWVLGCVTALCVATFPAQSEEPIRLASGEPLACVYFFRHWLEPWKIDEDAVRRDMHRLREMGFNTLLLDHEWSQSIARTWRCWTAHTVWRPRWTS